MSFALFPVLRVKAGREWPLKNHHHAIYRTAVEAPLPETTPGGIVEVVDSAEEFLCYAMLNKKAYICARAISFAKGNPVDAMRRRIKSAIEMRRHFFESEATTAYRLLNAEGDGIPGLIADRYGDTVVLQLTTLGMDRMKSWVVDTIKEFVQPKAIFEKSTGLARRKEGLEPHEEWLLGKDAGPISVTERGMKFLISLSGSQKTGLFLDQREMRSLVRSLAAGRTVLDCCSYVGGFSVSALLGGAISADAVDYDAVALDRAREHVKINGIDPAQFTAHAEDVFDFLRRRPPAKPFDFIILDPPAFAKRSSDLEPAKKAYTDLNRLAMQLLPPGGLLLTCSCSFQMDPALFQTAVFHAARQADRFVQILHRHRQAVDHPVNINHPETDYLKSLLLWVE